VNQRLKQFLAFLLVVAMVMPIASCSMIEDLTGSGSKKRHERRHERDKDEDEDEDEDEEEEEEDPDDDKNATPTPSPVPTPGSGIVSGFDLTGLTYPDHVPTYDEIHPALTPGNVTGTEASDLLDQIEHDILQESLSSSYVNYAIMFEDPEALGYTCDEVTWGEMDMDPSDDIAFAEEQLGLLYTIDYTSLDYQDRALFDKLVYDLELSDYAMQYTAFDYYAPVLDPLLGPQCEVLFILDVLDFDTVEDAENYILLIRDTDRYYDELCAFEEDRAARGFACTDEVYQDMVTSFEGLVSQSDDCFLYDSFEERLDNIPGITDADKTRLITDHNDAMQNDFFPEFQECADRMGALIGSGGVQQGVNAYPGGDAFYQLRFISFANSDKSIDQTKTDLETTIDNSITTMMTVAYSGGNWMTEYTSFDSNLGGVTENLDYLYTAVQPDFPDLPDHSYTVRDVPESLRENFSPAAYLGFNLDSFDSNLIISNGDLGTQSGITCAHEGYPGHMFQSVYTRSVCEHPYLYIADSTGYAEGWATYVENYSYKYFCTDADAQTLLTIENELNVLIYARVDIGINYEGWTSDDVADYFVTLGLGQPDQEALQQIFQLMTNEPGYGVKYGIGFLNTSMVMQSMREQFPDKTDEEIHTAYLNALPLTFEMIETRMIDALS